MPLTAGRTMKINNCFHEDKLPLPLFSQGGTIRHWSGTARGQPPTPQEIKHWGKRRIVYNLQIHPKNTHLLSACAFVEFSFLQRWREARGMRYWFQLQSAQSYDRRRMYENTQTDSGCLFFISPCASVHSLSLSLPLLEPKTQTQSHSSIETQRDVTPALIFYADVCRSWL